VVRYIPLYHSNCVVKDITEIRVSSPAAEQTVGVTNNSKMIGLLSVISAVQRNVSSQRSKIVTGGRTDRRTDGHDEANNRF